MYKLVKNESNSDLITQADIDGIPDISLKNKIIQVLLKIQYSEYKTKSKILIHCSLGMSRSPTLAIMYLMKKIKITFECVNLFLNIFENKKFFLFNFL